MNGINRYLTEFQIGILLIIVGIILLLHTLHIIETGLNIIIIIIAAYLIFIGFQKTGYYKKLVSWLRKMKKKSE